MAMTERSAQATTADTPSRSWHETLVEAAIRWRAALALVPLLIAALAVRLYELDSIPSNLTADETDFFIEIYRYIEGANDARWFYQAQFASLAPFGLYAMTWSVQAFGDSIFGLRMYAVIFSMATIAVFFPLAYNRTALLAASAATLMLATNILFLNFSRTAWANMNSAFLAISVTAALTFGLESKRWWWFAIAGVLIGLSPYAYVSARIIPVVAALMFPIAVIVYRDRLRSVAIGFGIAGVVALAVAAPLVFELQQGQWGDYTGRTRTVSIFNDHPEREDGWGAVPDHLLLTFQGFILLSNDDGVFRTDNIFRNSTEGARYAPEGDLFDPLTRILFFVGLAAGAWHWRKSALWWPMLLVPLGAQVFSVGTPDGARGVIVTPIIYLFVALGIATVVRGLEWAAQGNRALVATTYAGTVGVAIVISVFSARAYFDWMESAYALQDRGPSVEDSEFDEWSALQRSLAERDLGSFNTGTWRERQDRAGCLTGRIYGELCSQHELDSSTDALGETLVTQGEVPFGFTPLFLDEISPEDFRLLHAGRSDFFRETVDTLEVGEARAAGFSLFPGIIIGSVARLGSEDQARTFMEHRDLLEGIDYLGGPQQEALAAPDLGDRALLHHVSLDIESWEYLWQEGPYIAQVALVYPAGAQLDVDPVETVTAAANAQAARLASLAESGDAP
jgi:4-amino-4-deoxy-L-arabinose transferase-like glycosyltransferase